MTKPEIFTITSNEIVGRLDPYFYRPEFKKFEEKLKKSKWEVKELGKICKDLDSKRIPIEQTKRKKGKIPYYGASGIVDYVKNYIFEGNYLLVSEDGENLKSRNLPIAFSVNEKFWLNNHAHILKFDNINIQKNVEIFLNLFNIGKFISGMAQPKLNKENLFKIKIPLPPKEIQEKIISIMDSAYFTKKQNEEKAKNLIESIDNFVLEKLEIKIPKIIYEMTFLVNSNEVENNRMDCEFYQKFYKEIEKSLENGKYKLEKIKKVCEYINGFAFSSNDYLEESNIKLLTIKNITEKGIVFKKKTFLPNNFYEKYKDFQIKKNDLIFAMTGATIGKVSVFDFEDNILLNQRVGIIRKNIENLEIYFLFCLLNSKIYKNFILRESSGGAQPNISHNEILNLKIPLPPLPIQKEISNEVKKRLDEAKRLKKEAKEKLEKAKIEVENILLEEK